MGITYESGPDGRRHRPLVARSGRSAAGAAPRALDRGAAASLEHPSPLRFVVALIKEVSDDDVTGMSAEMAYRFLFAMFPLVLLSAAVLGLVGDLLGREDLVRGVVERALLLMPSAIAASTDGIVAELIGRARTFAALALIASLWGAASGMGALIKGLNRAYDVERPRPAWLRQVIVVVAALLVPPAGLALLVASVLGQSLLTWLGESVGITGPFAAILAAAQVIATGAMFFVGVAVIYRTLPGVRHGFRDVGAGAMVATVGWLLLTQAFGVYIANLDGYRATYGAFAAAISFLLWLYLVSVVVLVGAEINALLLPHGRRRWADGEEIPTVREGIGGERNG